MKNFITVISFVLITASIRAQSPAITWNRAYGGSSNDVAKSVTLTFDGGYIFGAWTMSTDGDITLNHGFNDIWLVKCNALGEIEWQKSYGGTDTDLVLDIKQTSDGGYVVAGSSKSTNGDVTGLNRGISDFWIFKVNSTGTIIWQKTCGGTQADYPTAIITTGDGGVVAAGATGSTNYDVVGNHGQTDFWVVKFNAAGDIVWKKCFGGSYTDTCNSIVGSTDGGIVLAGSSNSFDGDVIGNSGTNAWILKIDASGTLVWQYAYGGPGSENFESIKNTPDGGYIACGHSSAVGGNVTQNNGAEDVWIVKLNSAGAIQWQKSYGGTGSETAQDISLTNDGGYIVNSEASTANGDVSGTINGSTDLWILKINQSGAIQWQKLMGGSAAETADFIAQTPNQEYIISGSTYSNNGDITFLHALCEAWVVKLAPNPLALTDFNRDSIKLVPNPAHEYFTFSGLQDDVAVTIYGIDGKYISTIQTSATKAYISALPSGTYIAEIPINNQKVRKKFIKQ